MPQYSGMWTLSQASQAVKNQTWTGLPPSVVEYLVVAGGGSGGGAILTSTGSGGGGGGGFLAGHVGITAGSSYTVTVGAGGVGSSIVQGTSGANSVFGSITSTGGGAGGNQRPSGTTEVTGLSGGSGGGGSSTNTLDPGPAGSGINGQGNAGGTGTYTSSAYGGGGGGGAGTVGSNGTSTAGGNGGAGIASAISGTVTAYAGGGGGGTYTSGTLGTGGVGGGGSAARGGTTASGTVNTGGGGGGNGGTGTATAGGNGGSGIVIIRYPGTTQFFTGGAVTYANGYIVHTFYVTDTLAPTTPTAISTSDYQISRSLRFNDADSAYLNRTPASATNQKTWTWSGWVKRTGPTNPTNAVLPFLGVTNAGNDAGFFVIGALGDVISIQGWNTVHLRTTAVYRDYSAWYHIVVAFDTTQATAANRLKLYVNGVQETAFSFNTPPTLNADYPINGNVAHNIFSETGVGSYELGGYLTEVNFIDGQQLTPSSFGETNSNTGVWGPKAYTGTYGTNGFYLNFSDNSNTTAATLGKDYSGNGNNWTPNNFSVTAGVGNDSMVDTPTPYGTDTGVGGEVRGNYCTINPLGTNTGTQPTISNGNLQMTLGVAQLIRLGTISVTSGKWYWEVVYTAATNFDGMVGIATPDTTLNTFVGNTAKSFGYYYDGTTYNNGNPVSYGSSWTTGDVIGVALDMDNGAIYFSKNGTFQASGIPTSGAAKSGAAFTTLGGLTIAPAYNGYGGTQVINHGQRPFAYTAPNGFKALCTTNLPTPAIGASAPSRASKFFNTVLWTGDGAQTRSITGVGFQPDFTWMKIRADTPQDHQLYDAVRGAGAGKNLSTNTTAAEGTVNSYLDSDYGYLSSFDSDGFSVNDGAVATTGGYVNYSARTYVAWNWKASNATAVTNTSGTITSSVRANLTSGFSIVTYTGTGANATVGHGLGVAPSMVIVKNRVSTDVWCVYHASIGPTQFLILNRTDAAATLSSVWNNTAPTSSVINIGTLADVNTNASTYVAYCFAPVEGYSAFGSYTGNGSADGPFVHTGFRPAMIWTKQSNTTGPWNVLDNKRGPYNVNQPYLQQNSTNTEATVDYVDFLSNGFKIRYDGASPNASSDTIIYIAFAENPFKYSLAR
jgi:hypothetical protein